jgi:hypothetical protein
MLGQWQIVKSSIVCGEVDAVTGVDRPGTGCGHGRGFEFIVILCLTLLTGEIVLKQNHIPLPPIVKSVLNSTPVT